MHRCFRNTESPNSRPGPRCGKREAPRGCWPGTALEEDDQLDDKAGTSGVPAARRTASSRASGPVEQPKALTADVPRVVCHPRDARPGPQGEVGVRVADVLVPFRADAAARVPGAPGQEQPRALRTPPPGLPGIRDP